MQRQMQTLLASFTIAIAAIGCGDKSSPPSNNGPPVGDLAGIWVVESGNALGESAPKSESGTMKIEFEKDKAIWHFRSAGGWKTHEGTLWIDDKVNPKQMDLSQPGNPDSVAFCIYKIEGNKLTIKMGIERPRDFDEPSFAQLVFVRR